MEKQIKITCNGETKMWNKKTALNFFSEGAAACDGHERMRYEYIVECILCGITEIDDDEV